MSKFFSHILIETSVSLKLSIFLETIFLSLCKFLAGNRLNNAVTLKSLSSSLGYQALEELTHFEVEFRTKQADIPSLISLDGSYEIVISLRGGHSIMVTKKENEESVVLGNIMSQSK